MSRWRAVLLVGILAAACGGVPARPPLPAARVSSRGASASGRPAAAAAKFSIAPVTCEYRVSTPPEPPFVARVVARCTGGDVTGFAATEPQVVPFLSTASGAHPRALLPAIQTRPGVAELTYSVDLDGLARRAPELDTAQSFGRSLLAPASTFLLRPDPEQDDIPITVRFESPDVESGLRRLGDAYTIASHELKVATFTTFGPHEARDLALGDATVRLVILDGPRDLSADALATWVTDAARGVADFYRHPPAPRTLVVLAPLGARHGVPFGKMLPANAPGVIVLFGEHTAAPELYADWVLVHELFHVGTPSYLGEGKWYDEGLATYFEPLIRARLGWQSEAQVWREFVRDMPRGEGALTRRGLAHPEGYSDTYWGGALFCLLADVEARRASSGARGLEDGVRAVLEAGGVASEVWSLAHATELTDAALGAPILAELAAHYRDQGAPLDLDALFSQLGVSLGPRGDVVFDEQAPLAFVRHALVRGAPR